jgi:hypothetical protein
MNEEKAVLDFFAKPENLPLGLSVAGQMDVIREQMNSRFWQDLQHRIDTQSVQHAPEWQTQITEDRNAADMLVGLQCKLREPQSHCLFPMLEQQYLGGTWRIFFGLMWQSPPDSNTTRILSPGSGRISTPGAVNFCCAIRSSRTNYCVRLNPFSALY